MTESVLATVSAWLLAAIFATALRHKLSSWVRFCANVAAYKLLPDIMVKPASGVVICAEFVAIVALLVVHPLGFLVSFVLLAVYFASILINMLRGRAHIDCGCGDEPTGLTSWLLARNGALLLVSGAGFFAVAELNAVTVVVGLASAVIAYFLYRAIDQMITNHSQHQSLWLEDG